MFTGEEYQAKAAEQSVRDIVVQPARGLIVDAMGRPLVANRSSWVVSVDRTVLGKLADADREALLRRVATAVHEPYAELVARSSPVRPARRRRRHLLERLALPAGAGRPRRRPGDRGQDPRAGRGLPGRARPAGERARLPLALRHQRRRTCSATSARSPQDELDEAKKDDDSSVNGASVVGRAGVEKSYDQWLRGNPGYKKVAVDSMGRVLGDSGEIDGDAGRHPGHLDRRQGAGRRGAAARTRRS